MVNPGLIADYDRMKKSCPDLLRSVSGALDNTMDTTDTLNWCQQFQYLPCANLLYAQLIVHDLMDNGQFFS